MDNKFADDTAVLRFWFGDSEDELEQRSRLWWGQLEEVDKLDQTIRDRFGALHRRAVDGKLDDWKWSVPSCLALIIVIDQFSRNISRGTPEAFEHDKKALGCSQFAVENNYDSELSVPENIFLYMPMMHSENLDIQNAAVELYTKLANRSGQRHRQLAENSLKYAVEHRDIIEKFGRFPHRNEILDRPSTPDEKQFLARGASNYGQK